MSDERRGDGLGGPSSDDLARSRWRPFWDRMSAVWFRPSSALAGAATPAGKDDWMGQAIAIVLAEMAVSERKQWSRLQSLTRLLLAPSPIQIWV